MATGACSCSMSRATSKARRSSLTPTATARTTSGLYLPALRRVKRISSANRSGSFMGSEFAYEDLTPREVEEFTYRYLRDEPRGDLTCTVTERTPVDDKSGYTRQVVWRDQDALRVWKVEYYDRKDAHL